MLDKKRYFLCLGAIVSILLVGLAVGLAVPFPEGMMPQQDPSDSIMRMHSVQTQRTFRLIFLNNSRVFLMLTLGILTGGLLSIGEAFIIGYMVGFLVQVGQGQQMNTSVMLASLLPHGIPEVGSFMAVGALGLYFATRVYAHATKDRQVDWVKEARVYAKLIVAAYVVLILAALVEAYVSPNIVAHFMLRGGD
jgi:uncharacterized membrane protein SpoIIM required for sporulation